MNITNNQDVRNLTSTVAVSRALNFCRLHLRKQTHNLICKYFIMSSKKHNVKGIRGKMKGKFAKAKNVSTRKPDCSFGCTRI